MRYFFIMNPAARGGNSRKWFKYIFRILDQNDIDYEFRETANLEDAYRLSVTANKNDFDLIVSVGGDGTINRVLNGFFDEEGRRISAARMGVIHTGTSPDFCKSYGIPTDPIAATISLIRGYTREISVGKISYLNKLDPLLADKTIDQATDLQTAYFGCCANIGLGASLARNANSGIRDKIGDFAGTFASLLKTLLFYKSSDVELIRDKHSYTIPNVHNISIGKTHYIASGIKVKHNLLENGERFYLLTINNLKWKQLPEFLYLIYSGKEIPRKDFISLDYGNVFDIYGNNQNPEIEFDGDPRGYLPCRIETATDKLELIVRKK